jgi:hypothetical protein
MIRLGRPDDRAIVRMSSGSSQPRDRLANQATELARTLAAAHSPVRHSRRDIEDVAWDVKSGRSGRHWLSHQGTAVKSLPALSDRRPGPDTTSSFRRQM